MCLLLCLLLFSLQRGMHPHQRDTHSITTRESGSIRSTGGVSFCGCGFKITLLLFGSVLVCTFSTILTPTAWCLCHLQQQRAMCACLFSSFLAHKPRAAVLFDRRCTNEYPARGAAHRHHNNSSGRSEAKRHRPRVLVVIFERRHTAVRERANSCRGTRACPDEK